MQYEPIVPYATYAPWKDDIDFQAVYHAIKPYTLIDIYRCHELWSLVGQCAKLEGALLEVGVWRGGSSALIAKKALSEGVKDRVYLCDTFAGVVKAGAEDNCYIGGEHVDTSQEYIRKLQSQFELSNITILQGIFPDETGHILHDQKFRFVHIDVDVYKSAKDVLEWVWDRMVRGGLIVLDDYGIHCCEGITKVVNEFKDHLGIHFIHNLNGHAILVKI